MAAPKHSSEQYVKQFFTSEVVDDRPVSWKIALHSSDPGTGDAGEVSGGTYARQDVTFVSVDKGDYFEVESVDDVVFPAADVGQSYTVSHYTVRDGVSGECLATGVMPVPVPVVEGGIISFPASFIKVRGV